MAEIQKQSTRNSIFIYSGAVIGLSSNILFGKYLSPEQNGLIALLVAYANVIASFSNLGFNFSGILYFPQLRDKSNHNGGFLNISLKYGSIASLILSIVLTIWLIYFDNSILEIYKYLLIGLIPMSLGLTLFNALTSYMRFNFETIWPTLIKEFIQRFLIVLLLCSVVIGLNFRTFTLLYVFIFLLLPFLLIFKIKRNGYWLFKNTFKAIDPVLKRKIKNACLYGVITVFGSSALVYLDSIMVNSLLSTADTGIYVRNFYFATIILMASRAVQGISQTYISEAFKDKDFKTINTIYYKSCLTQGIVGMLFLIGIWGNIDNVYRIIPQEFEAGKYVILIIGIANWVNMVTGTNQLIIAASPYYKINTYTVFVLLALAVGMNFWLIPIYGLTGAAMATAGSGIVFNLIRSSFIWIKYKMQPYDYKYLLVLLFGGISWFVSTFIPKQEMLLIDIVVRSVCIGLLFGLPIYFMKISEDINALVNKLLKPIIRVRK